MKELKSLFVIGIFCTLLLIASQQQLPAMAVDSTIIASISHGGLGEVDICFESEGYDDLCDDFNLSEYQNPFSYEVIVEDPDEGDEFSICYEVEDKDGEECKNFEFDGSRAQRISITIPETGQGPTVNPEDFQIEDGSSNTGNASPEQPPVPALPPLPPLS